MLNITNLGGFIAEVLKLKKAFLKAKLLKEFFETGDEVTALK
jgi:hypothetical protein